jgi:hypothetical protein
MNVQLAWATPNAEEMIVKMARGIRAEESRQHGHSSTIVKVSHQAQTLVTV